LFKEILRINHEAFLVMGSDPVLSLNKFMKDKNVAMFAGNVRSLIEQATENKDNLPNWDLVTYPSFKEAPDTVPPITGLWCITSTSKHKDEALQLIDILMSKEMAQEELNQYLNPEFKKKHVEAVSIVKQSLSVAGEFDAQGNNQLNKTIDDMNKNNLDVNTAIQQMQEALQKKIDELK
jgi:ABC-type glycerol-3-phosphate transport system substrate-binding protein